MVQISASIGRRAARRHVSWPRAALLLAALGGVVLAVLPRLAQAAPREDDDQDRGGHGGERHANSSGVALTLSATGPIDRHGPFFTSVGSNGRSCGTCHQAAEGWSITPRGIRERFTETLGLDPLFRLVDGANSPHADVSTLQARNKAYSMLLENGVLRIGIGIPAAAQFELLHVDDPHGYASATELSLFRRPLATTNLRFLSTTMWDGRETFKDATSTDCTFGTTTCFASLHFDLLDQANSATVGHAQAVAPLTTAQRQAIVTFELGLTTAQIRDDDAGRLTTDGANGGPSFLQRQVSYFGINDTLVGDYRSHAAFTPTAMTLYSAWQSYIFDARRPDAEGRDRGVAVARRAVARGEVLFNSKPISIVAVKGLNDDLHVASIAGTCTTCHNTPNAGNHSMPLPLDIGIADASRRMPGMPLYTFRNTSTGELQTSTDPGRALITGKWADIGRFKGPTLRALAPRAPYFHNGFAKNLDEVVKFYNDRFNIGFTEQEKADLVAFLKTL